MYEAQLTLVVVGQGVGGGEQGGNDEGEADNWSMECLVTEACDVTERWKIKKVVNIFVVLKH